MKYYPLTRSTFSLINSRISIALFLGCISALIRFYNLGGQSLWFDETFTVLVARFSFQDGLNFLISDGVHPPLFYWIEKAALIMGETEWFVRLPAALFGVISVVLLFLVAESWIGRTRAILAALLLAVSPFHVWYSQEARMYSLLVLISLLCMMLYVKLFSRPTFWLYAGFVVASALAYITHYFTLFFPLIQFIHLTINLRRYPALIRRWTALQALSALPLFAWVYLLSLRPVQHFGIGWIPEPGLLDLAYTLVNFTVGFFEPLTIFHWFVVVASLVLAILGLRRDWQEPNSRALVGLWAFLPALLILLLSIRRPTYVDRFLIISLPQLMILMAAGLSSLSKRWMLSLGTVLITVMSWRTWGMLQFPSELQKENWRQAAAYLSERVAKDEIIVIRILQIAVPFQYYSLGDAPIAALEINREIARLDGLTSGYQGAWLVYRIPLLSGHSFVATSLFDQTTEEIPEAAQWIGGHGPPISGRVDMPGVAIFQFDLSGE